MRPIGLIGASWKTKSYVRHKVRYLSQPLGLALPSREGLPRGSIVIQECFTSELMGDGAEISVLKGNIIVKGILFSESNSLGSLLLSGMVHTFKRPQT